MMLKKVAVIKLAVVLLNVALSGLCFGQADSLKNKLKNSKVSIQHRFLAFDEANHKLVHIDERAPSKDWSLKLEGLPWDIQLVGNNKIHATIKTGYYEIDLTTGKLLKTVTIPGLEGCWSIRRLPDGSALAIGDTGGERYLIQLSKENTILRQGTIKGKGMRAGRITAEGNALATNKENVYEWDINGNMINHFKIPKGKGNYMALKDTDGNYWLAAGYRKSLLKLNSKGNVIQKYISPKGGKYFSGFQRLANGHIVQTNWRGHSPKKASGGPQLIEYNLDREIVWRYSNTSKLACPVSVIILDDLDTSKVADDRDSILKNRVKGITLPKVSQTKP